MDTEFVQSGTAEWDYMWKALEDLDGCTRSEDLETGEVWQYMGTETGDKGKEHVFRHRRHPRSVMDVDGRVFLQHSPPKNVAGILGVIRSRVYIRIKVSHLYSADSLRKLHC
jgi:hypothetical protein